MTLARTKGATATRDEKRTALVQLLEHLRTYVQTQADASVENGPSIGDDCAVQVPGGDQGREGDWSPAFSLLVK